MIYSWFKMQHCRTNVLLSYTEHNYFQTIPATALLLIHLKLWWSHQLKEMQMQTKKKALAFFVRLFFICLFCLDRVFLRSSGWFKTMYSRLVSNLDPSSCLTLSSARITGMSHLTWKTILKWNLWDCHMARHHSPKICLLLTHSSL